MSVVVIWSSSVSTARRGLAWSRAVCGRCWASCPAHAGQGARPEPCSRGARTPATLTTRRYWFPQSPGGIGESVCNLRVDGNGIPEDADDEWSPPEGGDRVRALRLGTSQAGVLRAGRGRPSGAIKPRHHRTELLAFLRQVAHLPRRRAAPGDGQLATHKTPRCAAGWRTTPASTPTSSPTSASWLNMVEILFSVIDRAAIRRGVFTSVKDLNARIRASSTAGISAHPIYLDQDIRGNPHKTPIKNKLTTRDNGGGGHPLHCAHGATIGRGDQPGPTITWRQSRSGASARRCCRPSRKRHSPWRRQLVDLLGVV